MSLMALSVKWLGRLHTWGSEAKSRQLGPDVPHAAMKALLRDMLKMSGKTSASWCVHSLNTVPGISIIRIH